MYPESFLALQLQMVYKQNLNYSTGDHIHLNSRTFTLPGELEEVLDLSAARLNVVRENLEMALRCVLISYLNTLTQANTKPNTYTHINKRIRHKCNSAN